MVEELVTLEKDLYLTLNSPHTPYLDGAMYIISGKLIWAVYLIFFIAAISYRQKPREVMLFLLFIGLAILLGDQISSGIIKPLFHRARPSHHILTADQVRLVLGDRGGGYGFISGHTMNFMTVITLTALIFRNRYYAIIGALVVLTIMYSRIYLGMHFITDVIPACILGGVLGYFLYWLYIRCRVVLLSIPDDMAKKCYIVPRAQIRTIPIALGVIYVFIWTIAPILFHVYYV